MKIKEGLKNLLTEILFPCVCVKCGREGEWWCAKCQQKNKIVCQFGLAVAELDSVTALFNYKENSPQGQLIKKFKYNFARDINSVWQEILHKAFVEDKNLNLLFKNKVIVPVPLYKKRLRTRGFNQAEDLAKIIAKITRSKLDCKNLIKIKNTISQAKLSGKQRRENLAGAFSCLVDLPASTEVVLIDDVFTTGTTMQECAKVLRASGTRKVHAFVLARG